jgi:hypothetical protein
MKKTLITLLFLIAGMGFEGISADALPNPSSGGMDGKAIAVLFLRGNVEIGFGQPIPINTEYVSKLQSLGYVVALARDFNPLTPEYLRQFNVVVWINPSPYSAGSRYFGPDSWQGGLHMNTVRENARLLEKYVSEGGGLLINPAIEEIGMPVSEAHNVLLKPYGIETECAQVRDKKHELEFEKISKKYPIYISWTEAVAKHPVTDGVRRIYYPAYTMRWDDNVTTLPLYPRDPAWIPFVKAMPEAKASWYRGTPYEDGHWKDADGRETPVIAAGRDFMKGRIAVISICHFHLFYYPYGTVDRHAECYFGAQDGRLMEKGFDGVPGDTAKLLDNIYRWLAAPGGRLSFGGYDEKTGIVLPEIPIQPLSNISEVWADKDPMNTGTVRPMKILVGARTVNGGGKGSVKEYANAARMAGVDVVAFTETYEKSTDNGYKIFVEECKANSDDKVFLLPGVDIADAIGNRFLILGLNAPVRPHLLVERESDEPGRKLIWTGHLLLGMGEVLPVLARPAEIAARKEPEGALPPDLYSHCPGVAVATYRDGKLVDDGLPAYKWQLFNASIPIPVAVQEVFSPEELIQAAKSDGLKCVVNADTPGNAAFYFRQGHMSAGGNPMRYYVSSGPVVDSMNIDDWQSPHWTIRLKAQDDIPVSDVFVYDQDGLYRHLRPGTKEINVSWSGDLGHQRWFLTILKDQKGRQAILSPVRTLPERHFIRCIDRQNWFGNLHFKYLTYTGRMRCLSGVGATILLPGAQLPAEACPLLQLRRIGAGFTVTDYLMDMALVPGSRPTGADNSPIFNALPNSFHQGRIRHLFYSTPGSKGSTPTIVQAIVDVRILKEFSATGNICPVIGKADQVKPGVKCVSGQGEGRVEWEMPKGGFVDLPVGGGIGSVIALTPLRVDFKGAVGFPAPTVGTPVKEGAAFHGEYLVVSPDKMPEIRKSIGFDGPPPYAFELSKGKLLKTTLGVDAEAKDYGVTGEVKRIRDDVWWTADRQVPIRCQGVRENWPLGLWDAGTGDIRQFAVFEGIAVGVIDISTPRKFYFGNLITASDERLSLAFSSDWTAERVVVEIHNPTDAKITARILSPSEIKGRKPVDIQVELEPGQTKMLVIP